MFKASDKVKCIKTHSPDQFTIGRVYIVRKYESGIIYTEKDNKGSTWNGASEDWFQLVKEEVPLVEIIIPKSNKTGWGF